MKTPELTYHADELVLVNKRNVSRLIPAGIFIVGIIYFLLGPINQTRVFFKSTVFIVGVFIALLSVILSLRVYFDKSPQLVINKKGIWSGSHGFYAWSNIEYYYFQEIEYSESTRDSVHIKTIDTNEDIAIDISGLKIDRAGIDKAISANSIDHKIIRLMD